MSYIHHARNADEHGIERITELNPGGVGIGTAGTTHVKRMVIQTSADGAKVEAETSGDPLKITFIPPHPRLIPVVDRGDKYEPPTDHLGAPIGEPSPIAIAELALDYLRTMTDEASKLP